MTSPINTPRPEEEGFHGAMAGVGLSDVIQLEENNRFSGCITVEYGPNVGRIFFRDGRVIHAEQGGRTGEQAFYDIMEWRTGRFSLEPNVSTTSNTIQRSSQFLLIEAHRLMDERRAGRPSLPTPPTLQPAQAAPKTGNAAIVDRVRAVRGVAYAAVTSKDGACVGDATLEGESLAGKAAYLAMLGNQLGTIFSTGALLSAVHKGSRASRHLFFLAARHHYLSVLVEGAADVHAVEAEVRRILGPQP